MIWFHALPSHLTAVVLGTHSEHFSGAWLGSGTPSAKRTNPCLHMVSNLCPSVKIEMDIHICGGCQSKFTDVYKFINHKLSCNLSSASSLKQTATLIKEAKVISQRINANKTAKKTSNTANFPADMVTCSEPLVRESNSSSRKYKRHSPVVLPHCLAQNALQFPTSNLSQASKQDVKVGSSELFTVADTKINDSNPSIQIVKSQEILDSHISSRRNVDISTDDIAVYVVSPKSFASSVKEQCDFIPQKKFQNNMTGTIVWADSFSMSHMGGDISNEQTADSTISSSINKKCASSTNSTYTLVGAGMQEQCQSVNGLASSQPPITSLKPKYPLDTDSTPSSDSSTPCPEDLEVGQISAAMLGQDRSQGEPHRTMKEASLNGSTSTAEDYLGCGGKDSVKAENKINDYVRNKAASAPIIKNEVHNRHRVSLEKRERLQGVSDDLLACSPCLDTLQVTSDISKKIALNKTSQSISANIPPQICYKAVFTSPSSAGHRLAPTQTQQLTSAGNLSNQENSNMMSLSRTQKNSKAVLYKNISASARRSKQIDSIKPQHSAPAPKRKTERKIAFEKIQADRISVEVSDVNFCSQKNTNIDKEHFETMTVDKHESTVLSSLSSDNGPVKSGNDEKAYKCLRSFELTDLNPLSHSIQKQEETPFQKTNTKIYEHKSSEEPQLLHIIGLSTVNSQPEFSLMTQGSDTIELFSPMSTALDENAVIMVYKSMDNNIHQIIAKNVESSQAESQSFQSVETCSLSDSSLGHGHNLTANHQPVFHQQVSDTDVYINIVPSDGADCLGSKLLFQNFVCSDPHLSQLIAISTGNSALGSSPGVFTVSQGAAGGSGEVVVQKLLDVKPKQPEPFVEKEKFIMRPRKAATSAPRAVDKSVSEARGTKIAQKGKTTTPPASKATKDLFSGAYNDDGQDGKKNKYFICKFEKCRYTTIFYKDFQRHYRTHTGERPFQCKDCGKRFNRSDKLKIHSRWHAGSKPFKCHHCDYAAVEGGSLKKHMRIHTDERPFKCQICSYASRNSSQLIVHLRTHTGDAPFHCTTCTAKFKINSDLKRHMRIHTGEKPFKCDRCDYKSSNKGNLKTHVKINHSEENEIPCPKCEFVTSSKKRLREHAKLHDTKPLERCTQCGYTCTSRNALRTHTNIHNKDKPHHCIYCSYSTKQGGNLKKHIENLHLDKLRPSRHSSKARLASNTGKVRANIDRCEDRKVRGKSVSYRKLFECSDCGSSFVRADSLRCHLKQHSPDASESTNKELATLPQTEASQTGHPSNDASSGYGCQGIQQIVAAASRIHEENLLSDNMAGDAADETKRLCHSSVLDNQAPHSKPYDISVSCPNIVVEGHINRISSNLTTDLIETGYGVTVSPTQLQGINVSPTQLQGINVSPTQLQGISEGSKRIHPPWEQQSYTMSVRADDSNSSASFAPSCKSGNTAGPIAIHLKSVGSRSDGAKPKQATSASDKGASLRNGPRPQKRKKPHDLTGPPASNASFVVSPISTATNQTKQNYYPDVIFQEITSGVGQIMDELKTAMLVTQQISDEPGMEHTYNIRLVPTGPQDATQMSALSQFSIQPGANLPYQPGATHIQIVLPVDPVLESSQPSSQVGGQIFPETLSLIEPQLLDSNSQPTMTIAASQLTSPQ